MLELGALGKPQLVAIYVRVSTEEQAEHGYSIDAQLETLRQYCKLYNKEIYDEYIDPGVSGKEMTKRHELQRLLRDAERGMFSEVIVWKFNRMSRKTKDLLEIVDRLDKCNVYFRSFSESFDTSTPMGKFALQMMGAVGELERNTIVENVKLGMKQRARMGYHNGGACLGYECVELTGTDRKKKKNSLVIVPEEAAVVRKIFDLYAAGKGFRAIANKLNRDGNITKKGNTFGTDSIREIITNPIYVGLVRYNRFEGWSEKRRRGKNSNPIIAEGRHEAIIDKELWDKVQALFQQKSKASPRVYDSANLLTGIIRCAQCHTPMVVSRTVNYLKDGTKVIRRYYSCGQFRAKGSSVCRANSVQADYAEQYVLAKIKEVVNQPDMLKSIVKAVNAKVAASKGPMEQELRTIGAKLKQLGEKKKKVIDAYEIDAIDRETLMTRMDELTADEDALHARRLVLTNDLDDGDSQEISFEVVCDIMASFDAVLAQSTPEQQKTLLQLAITGIEIGENRQISKIALTIDKHMAAICQTQTDPSANGAEGSSFYFQAHRKITLVL